MEATAEPGTMGKRRGRPKTSDRDDTTVKVNRTIVGKAKLVAAHRGTTVAELLSDLLSVPIDRAYAQMVRDLESKGG